MNGWYSRPVFFVGDVAASLAFYVEKLGFAEQWRHAEEGALLVAEVAREDCAIILNCQQPESNGQGRLFISVDPAPLEALKREFERRGAPLRAGWWGYDTMIVADPDGNELFFPFADAEAPDD